MRGNILQFFFFIIYITYSYSTPLVNNTNNTYLNYFNSSKLSSIDENDLSNHPCEQKTDFIIKYFLNQSGIPPEYPDFYKMLLNSGTNINDLGDYFGCLNMNYTKYFLLTMPLDTEGMSINMGLCYFKECDIKYLNKVKYDISLILFKYKQIKFDPSKILILDPTELNNTYRQNKFFGFLIVISLICLFIILSLIQFYIKIKPKRRSTLIFYIDEERRSKKGFLENDRSSLIESSSKLEKILDYFDFFKNSSKLFHIGNNTNNRDEALKIFDGVRFLSTCWVVFGHATVFPIMLGLQNFTDMPMIVKSVKFCFIVSGFYAVDVFFYISGFLLCLSLQKYQHNNINKFKIFSFAIINRYLRLLPLYFFIIFGMTYLVPFLGDGPTYFKLEYTNMGCHKYFWHNLLYINNFFTYGFDESCAGHSWYLANDMQFYVLSLTIFIFFNNCKIIRGIIFTFFFVGSNCLQMLKIYEKGFTFLDFVHPNKKNDTFMTDYYILPWMRICPFILGLYFCEFYLQSPSHIKSNENQNNIGVIRKINNFFINSNIACFILFIISMILINYSVFINYVPNNYELSIFWHAWLLTFNKTFFVFGLGCIIHLTFLGKFKFIYEILSFKIFTVFSRITYGVYLLHIYVIMVVYLSLPSLLYFKIGDFVFLTLGLLVFSAIGSYVFTVMFESPVVHAIKFNLNSLQGKKKTFL